MKQLGTHSRRQRVQDIRMYNINSSTFPVLVHRGLHSCRAYAPCPRLISRRSTDENSPHCLTKVQTLCPDFHALSSVSAMTDEYARFLDDGCISI